jgi:hypothetical protein
MAKKAIDKNKLKLPAKKEIIKPLANAKQAEIAVEKIHPPANGVPEKKKTIRYSIDIPEQMHRDLKMKCLQQGIDMKDYFLNYANKDLYGQ